MWRFNDALNEVLPLWFDYQSTVEEDHIRIDIHYAAEPKRVLHTFRVLRHTVSIAAHETLVDLARLHVVGLLVKAKDSKED
jgi:hypothetical protein